MFLRCHLAHGEGAVRVDESVALVPCDGCGTDTEALVTTTQYTTDLTTATWICTQCGHFHHIELGGDQ